MKLHEEKHKEEMVAVEDGSLGSGIQVQSSLRTGIQGNNSGTSLSLPSNYFCTIYLSC